MSLQLFLQPFLSSGEYSTFKELHQPRKWDWDIYGEERGTIDEGEGRIQIDPDGAFFGETRGEGDERVAFCIGCHLAVEQQDHLFFIPGPYRVAP